MYLDELRTRALRLETYTSVWMRELGASPADHLAWLLGKPRNKLINTMTHKDEEIIKALAGPHGYAIYQAMLIRRKQS